LQSIAFNRPVAAYLPARRLQNYAFAHLKRCLPRWLLQSLPAPEQLLNLLAEILRNIVRFSLAHLNREIIDRNHIGNIPKN